MNNIYTNKFFLIALALIIFTFGLVAQNLPLKEVALTESEQYENSNFQTYNVVEYLVYTTNGKQMSYDPLTEKKDEMNIARDESFYSKIYKGNLGKEEFVSTGNKIKTDAFNNLGNGLTSFKRVAINGNVINYINYRVSSISISGLKNYVLNVDNVSALNGSHFVVDKNPIAWLDKTHLLISKGEIDFPFEGIFILDLISGKEEKILDPFTYYDFKFSPSGRYLAISFVARKNWSDGEEGYSENSRPAVILFDFKTKKIIKITDLGNIDGWFTTKEVSQNPGTPGFFSSTFLGCSPFNCIKSSSLVPKLPFKCGEAYRVSRDGSCNSPTDCNYSPGDFPLVSWAGGASPHDVRAIDFTDQEVGGTKEDHLPVLASVEGYVIRAGRQNNSPDCDPNAGAGLRVQLKHADGTYTLYGHMSKLSADIIEKNPPVWVSQGQQLGLEGHTGHCSPCDFEHIHFERRTDPGLGSTSYWTQFSELSTNSVPTKGYLYISKNGPCSGNCTTTTIPSCGGTLTNQTNFSYINTRATYFSQMPGALGGNAASQNESAGEKVYEYPINQIGGFKVEILNPSYQIGNDFDVFIGKTPTGLCTNFNPLKDFKDASGNFISTSSGLSANTLSAIAPSGKYLIIVDGVNGSAGSYSLKVTPCPDITESGSSRSPNGSRSLPITAGFKNVGCGNFLSPTGSFYTRLFLSTDTYLGNDYNLVDLNFTGGWNIAPNGSYSYSFTCIIPSYIPSGWYYLIETLDNGNAVCEANEANSWYFAGSFYVPPSVNGEVNTRSSSTLEIFVPNDITENIIETNSDEEMTNLVHIAEKAQVKFEPSLCIVNTNGLNISVINVASNSRYIIANSLGQIISQGSEQGNIINFIVPNFGIYFLSIFDKDGNKCMQKVLVK